MIPIKDDNPTYTFPFVTLAIIAANVAVFIFQLSLGPALEGFIYRAAVIPYEITHLSDIDLPNFVPPPFTLFTAMFLHGGFLHLGGNMPISGYSATTLRTGSGTSGSSFFILQPGLWRALPTS
jgi:membrane associated rhomboid family serine protease